MMSNGSARSIRSTAETVTGPWASLVVFESGYQSRDRKQPPLVVDGRAFMFQPPWSMVKAFDLQRPAKPYGPMNPSEVPRETLVRCVCCDCGSTAGFAVYNKQGPSSPRLMARLVALNARRASRPESKNDRFPDSRKAICDHRSPRIRQGRVLIGSAGGEFKGARLSGRL